VKEPGDTLFCVEAMKHVNEVYAECRLTVEEVLAAEGDPVTPRQAVMRVRRDEERGKGEEAGGEDG
jgi:biotin carboxyl carrier protein